jgi:dTDP-4-dehydrorhamnose 3,5-epimerase
MKVTDLKLPGLKLIEPDVHRDARGYFAETYNEARYRAAGIDAVFVQDNESFSQKGVIRGLHWQAAPHSQAKLVRVIRGAVWDVAVDLRKGSPTFGQWEAATLTAQNALQFFVPRGFAHGFVVLEDDTLFAYKCDNLYNPQSERGLAWDDPTVAVKWPDPGVPYLFSAKDKSHPRLADVEPIEI